MSAAVFPINSDKACCIGCGYLLRGLEQPVCPECGRKFDPADSTSFATTAKVRLWRRWRWRLVGMFAFAILLVVAAPRGIQKGSLTFTCSACKKSITVNRWQLLPPKWMPRYPGYSWYEKASTSPTSDGTCTHTYSVTFNFSGGYVATSGSIIMGGPVFMNSNGTASTSTLTVNNRRGDSIIYGGPVDLYPNGTIVAKTLTINGQPITFETAASDLKKILNPMINGVGP